MEQIKDETAPLPLCWVAAGLSPLYVYKKEGGAAASRLAFPFLPFPHALSLSPFLTFLSSRPPDPIHTVFLPAAACLCVPSKPAFFFLFFFIPLSPPPGPPIRTQNQLTDQQCSVMPAVVPSISSLPFLHSLQGD